MDDSLGPRQQAILQALVREYIRTGEPVGSKHLVGRYRLGVSSATVRNEMARLEDLHYLTHPHTSAGRIPTDRGYRFFVDRITPPGKLNREEERLVEEEMSREPESLDSLLQRASDLIARITSYAAAVFAPPIAPARVRRVDLVPLAPRRVLALIIADDGRVEERMLNLDREVGDKDVDRVARDLNRELVGSRLEDAKRTLQERVATASASDKPLMQGVVEAIEQTMTSESRVFVGGTANLLGVETFERPTLARLYEMLERQTELLETLRQALDRPVGVRIGSELTPEEMRACSVVVAPYGEGTDQAGTVSIIGPTRMDYSRAMAAAHSVARMLEDTLGSITR